MQSENIWHDERCAFDEHLVFAHISKVNSVNLSWGTRHNVNSKPWRLSGALLATARAPECVLCLDFEDHQSHNNPWWSTVVGEIYHRWLIALCHHFIVNLRHNAKTTSELLGHLFCIKKKNTCMFYKYHTSEIFDS